MNNNKTPKMSRVNVLRRPSCNAALFTRHNICNSKHDLWNTLSIPIRKKQSVSIFGTPRIQRTANVQTSQKVNMQKHVQMSRFLYDVLPLIDGSRNISFSVGCIQELFIRAQLCTRPFRCRQLQLLLSICRTLFRPRRRNQLQVGLSNLKYPVLKCVFRKSFSIQFISVSRKFFRADMTQTSRAKCS